MERYILQKGFHFRREKAFFGKRYCGMRALKLAFGRGIVTWLHDKDQHTRLVSTKHLPEVLQDIRPTQLSGLVALPPDGFVFLGSDFFLLLFFTFRSGEWHPPCRLNWSSFRPKNRLGRCLL